MSDDLNFFSELSSTLYSEFLPTHTEWDDSPFGWIRQQPSRKKGAIGERLVTRWLSSLGFEISRPSSSEFDCFVNDKKVEIKFSLLWEKGVYAFQQLRNQDYDYVCCFGVSPKTTHVWLVPKETVLNVWREEKNIVSQHTGNSGVDTAWFSVDPQKPPEWIEELGGNTKDVEELLFKCFDRV